MDTNTWAFIFFYGNIFIVLIVFLTRIDKSRIKELITIGMLSGLINYTVEIIGVHYEFWYYPLTHLGYPKITVISSLLYFPALAMLFYQYLSQSLIKNIFLVAGFVGYNMIIEIITLTTTRLFIYGRFLNLFIAFTMYLSTYIFIILFRYIYKQIP